ncbi:MAG: GDSL-type esterase/lipase family protein [bacterium]
MRNKLTSLTVVIVCIGLNGMVHGADDSKPVDTAAFKGTIRMVCIGDSITKGVGADRTVCYAALIKNALGGKWDVTNLGVTGATLLRNGDKPYHKLAPYAKALEIKPDVATIALGTNDSKPGNWSKKAEFEADYKTMIKELRNANSNVNVYCCLPPPVGANKWSMSGDVMKNEIIPLIRTIAKDTKCYTIDLYESLDGRNGFARQDLVHPNNDGHKLMAATVFKALTGRDITAEVPKNK